MNMMTPKYDTCFFERYAMVSLATLLGEHYAHLVNRDRPDLQDDTNGIGIEVTRAIHENKNVANSLVNEMAGESVVEVNRDDLKRIKQSGYAYGLTDGTLIGRNELEYWSLALPLKRILEIKMHKVGDGFYGDFQEFGLFVFSKDNLNTVQIQQAITFMMEKQAKQSIRYERLFISQIQSLYSCNLTTGHFDLYKVSKEQRQQFYECALGQ